MNYLNTFVEPQQFHVLLRVLIDLYNFKINEKVSLVVLSGISCSGKTTLKRFMIDLAKDAYKSRCVAGLMAHNVYISIDGLLKSINSQICSSYASHISAIQGYICQGNSDSCQTFTDDNLFKIHEAINNGITYRKIYSDDIFVKTPASLILETSNDYHPRLDFTKDPNERKCVTFYLPYKKNGNDSSEIIEGCLREFRPILKFLEIKLMWTRFKFLVENIEYNLDVESVFKDILAHLFTLLVKNIGLSHVSDIAKLLCESQFAL